MMEQELLRAISARIQCAVEMLNDKEYEKALAVLNQAANVLPKPGSNNIKAAVHTAERGVR
ncbi:MAG: hypothetical protein IBX56_00215 [Methylomicrobium sp.]|nr:hypothetical protein [Methylomicrobium sp.]